MTDTRPAKARVQTDRFSRPGLGITLTLGTMLAFAVMDGVSKHLAQAVPIPQILWVRYFLFTVLAVLVLRKRGLGKVWKSGQPGLQFLRSVLIVLENAIFVLAFTMMPLADMHAIAAASPLIVIALSVPMLGERVGPRRWFAVLAGFAGVLLIVRPGFQELGPKMSIAILGTVMWAVYQILVRQCARTDSGETTWLWSAVVGLAATTLVGPFYWIWPSLENWGWLLAIAALGIGSHLALIYALTITEPSILQPFNYTLFLWAIVVGYVAFGDWPDAWTFAGAAVILASGLYAWHRERVRARGE